MLGSTTNIELKTSLVLRRSTALAPAGGSPTTLPKSEPGQRIAQSANRGLALERRFLDSRLARVFRENCSCPRRKLQFDRIWE